MGKFIITCHILSKKEIVATLRHRPSTMLGKRLKLKGWIPDISNMEIFSSPTMMDVIYIGDAKGARTDAMVLITY